MTYAYVGRAECGCVVAATKDRGDKYTGQTVAEFIEDGLTVDRMLMDDAQELFSKGCPHGERVGRTEEAM